MAQVLVRNLDEQVVNALRRKAELHDRSLQQELRIALTAAARLTREERVALARRVRSLTPATVSQTDSAELIRQHRDARRPWSSMRALPARGSSPRHTPIKPKNCWSATKH
jgi:plasmid stability protein